jgi:hypothetical protein
MSKSFNIMADGDTIVSGCPFPTSWINRASWPSPLASIKVNSVQSITTEQPLRDLTRSKLPLKSSIDAISSSPRMAIVVKPGPVVTVSANAVPTASPLAPKVFVGIAIIAGFPRGLDRIGGTSDTAKRALPAIPLHHGHTGQWTLKNPKRVEKRETDHGPASKERGSRPPNPRCRRQEKGIMGFLASSLREGGHGRSEVA